MSINLGIVMDPIESITPYKDTTLAMMLAAQARNWDIHCIDQKDIYLDQGRVFARRRQLRVFDDNDHWFEAEGAVEAPLSDCQIILMRKDPPFNMDFIYTTYLLELAAAEGVYVSNRPSSLREVNEKLATAKFSQLCPPTLVTTHASRLKDFIHQHEDAIIKPLDGMGGAGIYRLRLTDPNLNIILDQATHQGNTQIMAQRYVPEIEDGDKRVLVVNGHAVPFALARIPAQGETRGNLAAGGRGVAIAITDTERQIVDTVAPYLLERGLLFVGLDVIGSYLTEINVTSPTCVREIDAHMHQLADAPASNADGYTPGIADIYLDAVLSAYQQDQSAS
jgi:glutathione synthase